MQFLYNISIRFYILAIRIASLFRPKAKLWIKGRKNIFQKLKAVTENENNIVWLHCASLGEFEQGRPIMEGYKKKYPTHKILLTFFPHQDMRFANIIILQIGCFIYQQILLEMQNDLSVL